MSSHSRSSSEVESIQFNEVLPVFIADFQKDFSFNDINENVKELFTKHEYASILDEKGEKSQIIRLFWVLCSKDNQIVQRFLDQISPAYNWLAEKVLLERNLMQSKQTEHFVDMRKMLRSNNQKHTDYNVHRMQPFVELRRYLKKLKPYENVVLLGDLGTGKKWLALDVCSEYTVMKAMDFKIYWIDVSQCSSPEQDLLMLQKFRLLIGGGGGGSGSNLAHHSAPPAEHIDSIANRILELQQSLRTRLRMEANKNCLLVLKNVQNVKTWENFNLGCKLLLITRNKKVSDSLSKTMTKHMTIQHGLTLTEFYCLFERYLQRDREKFPSNATDIYYHSQGHPYLLSIIAQNLRQKKSDWNEWIRNLQSLQITDNKFTTVIEISLKVLTPELMELYATFAIFPHFIYIPLKLLATLWNKTPSEAEYIVEKFHKYSIVTKMNQDDVIVCILPFVYSSYLKNNIQNLTNFGELHRKVIDYYKIEEAFLHRTEIELFNSQHDSYFYYCIPYHLHGAGRLDLFSKIYLDYGFLEQKIRAVGLLNTIGDLRHYENEITDFDSRRRELLRDLREFLPIVEEKLVHSKDTSLLQYALMASGSVYEEAVCQVKQFPQKVWFAEKGNFHRRRQIVNLLSQAKIVYFLEQDICLIVLDNNNMLLYDISLERNNNGPVYLINDQNQGAPIIEARLFRDDNFILTLDNRGKLKLWSIADDRRRSLVHKRSSKKKEVNPLNFKQCPNVEAKLCKQTIQESFAGKNNKVVAFHIEQLPAKHQKATYLHVAFDSGHVCLYKWIEELEHFQTQHVPPLPTGIRNIRVLCKILEKYYMMLSTAGTISFWNLRDSSKVCVSFEWPETKSAFICYEIYTLVKPAGGDHYICILFVFGDRILLLSFEQQKYSMLEGKLETLYECTSDSLCVITCAKLSQDARYLVLGTKHGLIVIDVHSRSEILRSNVSEAIACVDIYALDDRVYKYIIVCGVEHKKQLNIFALRKTGATGNSIGWSHNLSSIGNEESDDPQLEPGTWLLGQKLYDITYDRGTLLVAADTKNRIHQVCTTNTKNWSIVMPTETSHSITAITTYKDNSFAAFQNGAIFNITQEIFLEPSFTDQAISYLQLIDEHILVAATSKTRPPLTRVRHFVNGVEKLYQFDIVRCFKSFEHYLLLVDIYGSVMVLDVQNGFEPVQSLLDVYKYEAGNHFALGGCDFKNSHLFLATTTYNVFIFRFNKNGDDKLEILKYPIYNKREMPLLNDDSGPGNVTALAAAHDARVLAIGLHTGDIEIYKVTDIINQLSYLYRLQSHATPIYDMKLSPDATVLVSVSEQLCFWNIAYIINNPLSTQTKMRRSSRFSSQHSSEVEEVDAKVITSSSKDTNHLLVQTAADNLQSMLQLNEDAVEQVPITSHLWQGKHGPADKPELLACIKFDGNRAQKIFANPDFTQFNTIDDEGVLYHLTLLDIGGASSTSSNANLSMDVTTTASISYTNGHHSRRDSYASASNLAAADVDCIDDNVII